MRFRSILKWRKNEVEYERNCLQVFLKDSKLFLKFEIIVVCEISNKYWKYNFPNIMKGLRETEFICVRDIKK